MLLKQWDSGESTVEHVLEAVLVCLLGHEYVQIREEATKLLNMLYDGVNWQYDEPFCPKIRRVHDTFTVDAHVLLKPKDQVCVLLSAPSFDTNNASDHVLTLHGAEISEKGGRCSVKFPKFPRAGFYDWKFFVLYDSGEMEPLRTIDNVQAQGRFIVHPFHMSQQYIHEVLVDLESDFLRTCTSTQGKSADSVSRGSFDDVRRNLDEYKVKGATCVYLLGAIERDNKYDAENDSFNDPDASPMSVVCRRTFNRMLGGNMAFRKILTRAKELKMHLLVQCNPSVSASRPHRRYKSDIVSYMSETGELLPHRGTDSCENQWEDQLLPNYRKLDTWNTLIDDILSLAKHGVDGIVLQQAQSWPIILAPDMAELRRVEMDGSACYTEQAIFEGVVVQQNVPGGYWEAGDVAFLYPNPLLVKLSRSLWKQYPTFMVFGQSYWDRDATLCRSGVIPYGVDLARAIAWASSKRVDKEGVTTNVPDFAYQHKSKIHELQRYLESLDVSLPEGAESMVVRNICTDSLPYPSKLFGRNAWTAVDLLCFLPGIPMTFSGEIVGQCHRIELKNTTQNEIFLGLTNAGAVEVDDVSEIEHEVIEFNVTSLENRSDSTDSLRELLTTSATRRRSSRVSSWSNLDALDLSDGSNDEPNRRVVSATRLDQSFCESLRAHELKTQAEIGPEYGFDLAKIQFHYSHRLSLRKKYMALHAGRFRALKAWNLDDTSSQDVVSFARWIDQDVAIIASNFSTTDASVYADCSSLTLLDRSETGYWIITNLFREGEESNESMKFTGHELLHRSPVLKLAPHSSVCWYIEWHSVATAEQMEQQLSASSLLRLASLLTLVPDACLLSACRYNYLIDRVVTGLASLHSTAALEIALLPLSKVWTSLALPQKKLGQTLCQMLCLVVQELKRRHQSKLEDRDVLNMIHRIAKVDETLELQVSDGMQEVSIDLMPFVLEKHVETHPIESVCVKPPKGSSLNLEATSNSEALRSMCRLIAETNEMGSIVFLTPELGRWSTVGGLGVMVDELTVGLAQLGIDITVISPYYDQNRKGKTNYLAQDGIHWTQNVSVTVDGESIQVGVHEGRVKGVRVVFLHQAKVFPCVYPPGNASSQVRLLSVFAKASLEVLCQIRVIPSLIITNDWMAGFTASYARSSHFGHPSVFHETIFFHIIHNLDTKYEGRQYPADHEGDMYSVHKLPVHLLVDPFWGGKKVINPSRAAILSSQAWATVSLSYREELLRSSPLAPLLGRIPHPFAHSNGIPIILRRSRLLHLKFSTHATAKAQLQRKYFQFSDPDPSCCILSFVGRITEQKGVHLILECVEHLIHTSRVQILVGGPISPGDPYGEYCATLIHRLRAKYPNSFYADPSSFFTDGPLVNLGSDFGLMPSKFEPGGIVQHEYFVAGTPVVAFKTGGLKDTVHEFNATDLTGNGFVFDAYNRDDLLYAIHRALDIFSSARPSGRLRIYEHLRQNAALSPMDVSIVSREWYREFCRLRRILAQDLTTLFVYDGQHQGAFTTVLLVGTFNSWDVKAGIPMMYSPKSNAFTVRLRLPPGAYSYKFVVNGQWTISAGYPTLPDELGLLNNVVTVVAP